MADSNIIKLRSHDEQAAIQVLQETLDLAKNDGIEQIVVVGCMSGGEELFRNSSFSDLWRMLGALEYAKAGVLKSIGVLSSKDD